MDADEIRRALHIGALEDRLRRLERMVAVLATAHLLKDAAKDLHKYGTRAVLEPLAEGDLDKADAVLDSMREDDE
jgi:hypothetical protein